jgi:UDP-N-acetylmuramoyl-tripeptide--D-alanyl-D-alanine ligase
MFKVNELLETCSGILLSGRPDLAVAGISTDTRTIRPDEAFIALRGNNFNGHDFIAEAIKKKAACVIQDNPSLAHKTQGSQAAFIQVKDTTVALGDIARYWRQKLGTPVIAVTGSNGKTTVKDMIACVLSRKFKVLKSEGTKNNHIGVPATLLELRGCHQMSVLELGTNHPGEIKYLAGICQPNIAVITNIGPSHLEFLRNLNGVFNEKRGLIKYLQGPCIALVNADDRLLAGLTRRKSKKPVVFTFGLRKKADFSASCLKGSGPRLEFVVNKKYRFALNTFGRYNVYNALAAIAVGRIFGLGHHKDIASALANFDFPQGRFRLAIINNIRFIDDSYNSNPLSLKQALDTLAGLDSEGRRIFVMGDMLELGARKEFFHRQAGRQAAASCDVFITVGRLSESAAGAARASGFAAGNLFACTSTAQARDILFNRVLPGPHDVVLVKGSRAMRMEEIFKRP